MPRSPSNPLAALAAALLALAGCGPTPDPAAEAGVDAPPAAAQDRPALGLMTSLPLYWPLGAGLDVLAAPDAPVPWQRGALAHGHELVMLDTLTSIPGLTPEAPETDPLAGLERLAVIQPRGLSPADNVALDAWVRGGGRLLLVLDPALTGDYDLPLGDPRRPASTALIPPVVARWGLEVSFDETQAPEGALAPFAGGELPLALSGTVAISDPAAADCSLAADGAVATCRVGKGRVTLIADAAVFEHRELAGGNFENLAALLAAAFE